MRVLVAGGAGFIGRPTVKALLDAGHKVLVIDNHLVGPAEKLDERAELRVTSWRDESDGVKEPLPLIKEWGFEAVFWLAAIQGYTAPETLFEQHNVSLPYSFFELIQRNSYFRKIKRIVLASSQAVYAPALDVRENSKLDPPAVYGLSKLQQEMTFMHFGRELKIPTIALRYSIVLGAGQSLQSSESGILRNWHQCRQRGVPGDIYGDGQQIRDFVHVDDVVRANMLALDADLTDFADQIAVNIGGHLATVSEVARIFSQVTDSPEPRPTGEPGRPGGDFSLTSSSETAKHVLNWGLNPELGIERQVRDFVDSAT
jgi:nucleoside-diphosphate-sugar epimerase